MRLSELASVLLTDLLQRLEVHFAAVNLVQRVHASEGRHHLCVEGRQTLTDFGIFSGAFCGFYCFALPDEFASIPLLRFFQHIQLIA